MVAQRAARRKLSVVVATWAHHPMNPANRMRNGNLTIASRVRIGDPFLWHHCQIKQEPPSQRLEGSVCWELPPICPPLVFGGLGIIHEFESAELTGLEGGVVRDEPELAVIAEVDFSFHGVILSKIGLLGCGGRLSASSITKEPRALDGSVAS